MIEKAKLALDIFENGEIKSLYNKIIIGDDALNQEYISLQGLNFSIINIMLKATGIEKAAELNFLDYAKS